MTSHTRREFGRTLVLAGAATALGTTRAAGANDRIRLGFIGLGNRGDQVLDAFLEQPDIEVVALCDLHPPYTAFAANKVGGQPQQTSDYRRVLDRSDVDAVVISTPDHWHALQTVHACQARKHIYVEKPLSLRLAEGRRMVEAVQRYDRVCQVGIHRRSSPVCREAAEFVRNGGIGKVTAARAFHIQNEFPVGIGNEPNSDPPPGFDWDAWLGPAPAVPYNKNRTFYRFRWFLDYSGGQVTNFGVHYLDFIHWALGVDAPLRVTALGGRFSGIEDNREIADTLEVLWEYPGGTLVTFTQINANAGPHSLPGCEVELRGTLGTLYLFGDGYEVVPDALTPNEFPARTPTDRAYERGYRQGSKPRIEARKVRGQSTSDTSFHARNFLDCIRSREVTHCPIEVGHRSTSTTLLGNIALDSRTVLEWDARAERITNSPQANEYLNYRYRDPYKLPSV